LEVFKVHAEGARDTHFLSADTRTHRQSRARAQRDKGLGVKGRPRNLFQNERRLKKGY
jgi:hypothetical protein